MLSFLEFDGAGYQDNDTEPIVEIVLIAVEIKYGFGKEPKIEGFVFLELNFAEIDDSWGNTFWG
jgi:hypothetical protein